MSVRRGQIKQAHDDALDAREVEVAIQLPLPIHVVSELGRLLDQRWPGSQIKTSTDARHKGHMVFVLDPDATPAPDAAGARCTLDKGIFFAWEADAVGITQEVTWEQAVKTALGPLIAGVEGNEAALNYIEQYVVLPADPDRGQDEDRTYCLVMHTHDGKSAHELRVAAESQVRSLSSHLRRVLDGVPGAEKDARNILDHFNPPPSPED